MEIARLKTGHSLPKGLKIARDKIARAPESDSSVNVVLSD